MPQDPEALWAAGMEEVGVCGSLSKVAVEAKGSIRSKDHGGAQPLSLHVSVSGCRTRSSARTAGSPVVGARSHPSPCCRPGLVPLSFRVAPCL